MAIPVGWEHFRLPVLHTMPGGEDVISLVAHPSACPPDQVEFRLLSDPGVTWWKGMVIRQDGREVLGQSETVNESHAGARLVFSIGDLANTKLEFWKAKMFGVHTHMYEIDLDLLPPDFAGHRLEFTWFRD